MTNQIHNALRRMVVTWRPRTLSAKKLEEKAAEVMELYRSLDRNQQEEVVKWFMGKVFRAKVHAAREKDEWRPRRI